MFSLPAAVSEMRYPESSRYLASGCLLEITVVVASGAPACLPCLVSGAGAEQPARIKPAGIKKIDATKVNLTVSNITRSRRNRDNDGHEPRGPGRWGAEHGDEVCRVDRALGAQRGG